MIMDMADLRDSLKPSRPPSTTILHFETWWLLPLRDRRETSRTLPFRGSTGLKAVANDTHKVASPIATSFILCWSLGENGRPKEMSKTSQTVYRKSKFRDRGKVELRFPVAWGVTGDPVPARHQEAATGNLLHPCHRQERTGQGFFPRAVAGRLHRKARTIHLTCLGRRSTYSRRN
jgi:hypothetical protein